jgi:hypothetical protein
METYQIVAIKTGEFTSVCSLQPLEADLRSGRKHLCSTRVYFNTAS